MRIHTTLLALLFLLTACDDKPIINRDSAGRMNDILVVMNNDDWEGAVGDTIRKQLAQPLRESSGMSRCLP